VPSLAELNALLTASGAMFEMEERTIRGVRVRTWKNAPPSLRAILEQSRIHGAKDFLVYEDERLTFEQHFAHAAHLARVLSAQWGVRKGDRVAIAMRNFPEWSIAFWAAAAAGAIVVPLNAWWTGDELEYGLADSGTKVLFCDGDRAARLTPRLAALKSMERIVAVRAEGALPPNVLRFEEVLAHADASDDSLPAVELDPEDDATIFYTSGTTGKPKGALGTHRNICGNIISLAFVQARSVLRRGESLEQLTRPDRPQYAQLLSVPLFHATGCHSILVANTAFGGRLVMMYKWDPERALELIERERLNSFGGVPAMVMQVLEHPSFATRDLSSVTNIGYGGAPAPPDLVRRMKEHFPGVVPSNGYGLTETSSVTTLNAGQDYQEKPDSVGPPVPVCDVQIVDDRGNALPVGGIGEIWIKGPNIVKGYWNKPEATAETFTDGWLHSGDVGYLDEEGFVYISDRAKDMLIRGGENVYCVEIESVLYEHPAVMDAAVVGVPHRVLGEEVGAVVTLVPGKKVSADDLRKHVAAKLASFKVPSHLDIRSEPLPRNPNGKILKRQLRDELAQLVGTGGKH
jgi:long-chain acyl-CoA synthetase